MKKGNIILSIIFSLIIIPIIFIYLSFANSIDCSQLVIDTYELHSKINIPEVEFVNCHYDENLNTRISIYDLKKDIDLKHFKKVNTSFQDYLLDQQLLTDLELPKGSEIYLASGERWGTKWTYAVDRESNRLWAELRY